MTFFMHVSTFVIMENKAKMLFWRFTVYVNVWGILHHQTVTISPQILIFPAWVAVLAFPVVGRCRTQL